VSSGSAGARNKRAFIGCWGAGHDDGEVAARSGGGGPAKVVEQRKEEGNSGRVRG
jgi:hypothetical protein